MAEDLINNKDIYFPSQIGTNDKLITLLNRASQTLCDWFSKADKTVSYTHLRAHETR